MRERKIALPYAKRHKPTLPMSVDVARQMRETSDVRYRNEFWSSP
jgi:hypothetical protein